MELHFLGTGAANPTPSRGASSTVLRNPSGMYWMFDCGEGTQTQLMKSALRPGKLERIFITHLHGDHLFGLPGLLCTISMNCPESRGPIHIYGPKGLKDYLTTCLRLSDSLLKFPYIIHELCDTYTKDDTEPHSQTLTNDHTFCIYPNLDKTWDILDDGNMKVSAAFLTHRIPCVGYVIQEANTPGKLNAELLKSMGVPPGPLYAKIKNGESVLTQDGRTIKSCDVLSPPYPGRKIVILGDTCNSEQIAKLAGNADILVHEATNENAHQEKCIENGHSTPGMAAEFARTIGAKKLVLTHFSQRYKAIGEELKPGEESVEKLLKEAEEAFGDVVVTEDLLIIDIPKHIQ